MMLLLWACAHEPEAGPETKAPPAEPTAVAEKPATTAPVVFGEADAEGKPTVLDLPGAGGDPQSLYAGCKARVEGQETDGECSTDADCARAGCSREVCLPAAQAANVSTTCDVQPCFAVLDHCGCVAGRCSWSLKSTP